ncbi:MAG: 1-deoxy-D-xylulose-5-phosphate reductoisomerase [Bacillota bacterium]
MAKRLAILGSTGSIGRQALEVVREFSERFSVLALAGGKNLRLLVEQAHAFHPKYVVIGDRSLYPELKTALSDTEITVLAGLEGLTEIALIPEVDLVLTALVGSVGIRPTLAAIKAGKTIALANKETLVAAGAVIIPAAKKNRTAILPVDSEHSAIFQCLEGRKPEQVARIILTASGGPFRSYQPAELEQVTLDQALNHPNWRMGGKITIDSATMFNKGLEVIEAHWLFGMDFDRIEVVIHPESIIHSMVELVDGSIIAQLGLCDMKLPIQVALVYPERLASHFPKLDMTRVARLSFEPVNYRLFPAVELAYEAGRAGGTMPAVLNAANEEAVYAFLNRRIKFTGIVSIVSEVMGYHQKENWAANPGLDDLLAADEWAREMANQLLNKRR